MIPNPEEKRTILLVEDEVELCEILQDELTQSGYDVVVAHDGDVGLERLHDICADLIICDRAMPKMSGYDLLERIRGAYPQYKTIPFIFLTALTDQRDRNSVRHLRPAAYLEKPVDFERLRNEIEKALQNIR